VSTEDEAAAELELENELVEEQAEVETHMNNNALFVF